LDGDLVDGEAKVEDGAFDGGVEAAGGRYRTRVVGSAWLSS
jgi:hypothetical protein